MARDSTCHATLRAHGAAGDGIRDDTDSIVSALKEGCALDGEGLRYRITRSLRLRSNTNLRGLTLLQAIPSGELLRPIFARGVENITLTDIHVDRGNDPYRGTVEDAAGLWLDDVRNVTLTDIEVTGDGPGTGIMILRATNVVMTRAYVHDMHWAVRDAQPCNEVVQGIRVHVSANVILDAPRVGNLLPESIVMTQDGVDGCARQSRPQSRRVGEINNMTDGIDPTGNLGMRITNPEIWRTGEGIDISGGTQARDLLITGGKLHDIASACYKLTAHQGPNLVIRDSEAVRCGLWGYVVMGPVTGLTLANNRAIDTGASGAWKSSRIGFYLSYAKGNPVGTIPTNIRLSNNHAIDGQSPHTMDYGFFIRPDPSGSDQHIVFEDNTSTGHRERAVRCDVANTQPGMVAALPWCPAVNR